MSKKTGRWHKYPEEKPTKNGEYLCFCIGPFGDATRVVATWWEGFVFPVPVKKILAWTELPPPPVYKNAESAKM